MRQESGFTMVEMLVTIAIGAILLAMAVPGFRDFIQSTQMTNTANEFALSINIARTEAAKRSTTVYVSALPTNEAGNEWGEGWRVWLDSDDDEVYDDGEEELHRAEALDRGLTLNSVDGITKYKYLPSGRAYKFLSPAWIAAGDTLHLCDERGGRTDRELSLNAIGRLTVETKELCP